MASTETKKPAKSDAKPKRAEGNSEKDILTQELSAYFGVDVVDDEDKFIEAVNEAALDAAKEDQQEDPQAAAIMSEKLGRLRQIMAEASEGKLTPEQKALKERIMDEYTGVGITFPDDQTWIINVGGKEDSGHMTAPIGAVLASAQHLKKVPASN